MERFPDPLKTEHLEKRTFKLLAPFRYYVRLYDKSEVITVPKGFITDLASIPRPFWSIIGSPNGRYGRSAVIHDYIYRTPEIKYTRKRADEIFYEGMVYLKVNFFRRKIMYFAVRIFAWLAWKKRA